MSLSLEHTLAQPTLSPAPTATTASLSSSPSSTTTTTVATTPSTPSPTPMSDATTTSLYKSYHSQIENLKRLPIPYSDIYHALSSHDTMPLRTLHERFRSASTNLTTWLETAEMAVFALSMDVGQDGATDKRDIGEMDVIMNRFQPNVDMLVELKEKIEFRLRAASFAEQEELASLQIDQYLQQTIQGVKSSWASLKQMLEKVKNDLAGAGLRAELMTHMDNVLVDIDDICASIDTYNNERSAMTSDEEGFLPSKASTGGADAQAKQRSLETLANVDSRIEALIAKIDHLDNRVGSLPKDETGLGNESKDALQSRYQQVLYRWDDLKFRRERISEELKEDKWLEVFEQVAEQVESMMESIERAVTHCQGLIDHVKLMVRQRVVPDAPIDREHLYSIFKSFEAKHKYYTPAVNQMLEMLENGIESRTTRNMDVISRHQAMNVKWDQLENGLDCVDRELDDIERLLDILDNSRTPYLPKLPLKKAEPTTNAAKKTPVIKPGWNSSPTPTAKAQAAQKQRQQQTQQAQRGRQPASSTARSPMQTRGRSRSRSPVDDYYSQRPWSPANSNSSLSQSGLLTASSLNNYRSLSPSPTRMNGRVRPWCPSVSVSSPGIPGIPQLPLQASTSIPRPVSSMGQNRMESPAPTGRAGSAMSGGSRSNTSSPSIPKTHSQIRPVFSPSGSNSRLSNGARSTLSSPSPTPTGSNGRKTQLPMPSSRPSSQRSAPSPSPQMQRSQYGREATSPIPSNYASNSISSRLSAAHLSSADRQRQYNSGAYGQSHHGHYDDRNHHSYNSRPGSAASGGRDYHYGYDEPMSPSVSSVSSMGSSNRHYGRERPLSDLMDKMNIQIEDAEPYTPTRGDELDEEFAKVVNSSPIQMQIRRLGEGKYYFGGRVDEQNNSLIGGKMVLCRLMEYGRISGEDDSGVSSGGSLSGTDDGLQYSTNNSRTQIGRRNPAGSFAALQAEEASKKRPRKVLVRVGGGWQDLDIFLLDHSSLAQENIVVRGY
ncbi:hypothetical protein BGZ79_010724 [Entomortierella chlamydospora]|nr:hypothetical protein BGZ79_010724 [Entomortierella chlamydospora]